MSADTPPVPKPRKCCSTSCANLSCVDLDYSEKVAVPVPLPRKSKQHSTLASDANATQGVDENENTNNDSELDAESEPELVRKTAKVVLRRDFVRRATVRPIVIRDVKLLAVPEDTDRPKSFSGISSIIDACIETSHYDNVYSGNKSTLVCSKNDQDLAKGDKKENDEKVEDLRTGEDDRMSIRAISAARSKDRPVSAYEESPVHRAAIFTMSSNELAERDRAVASSCTFFGTESKNNRSFSSNEGAIRVQVEDITSYPSYVKQRDTSRNSDYSFDSRKSLRDQAGDSEGVVPTMKDGSHVTKWAVPSEYASSAIAQELSESFDNEKARPPVPTSIYANDNCHMTRDISTRRNEEEGVYSDFIIKRNSTTTAMDKPAPLLEQIIRTHTIWFLPHLGRPEVLHLLHHMKPGNFIVRASTRENCMALSVRQQPTSGIDTDHYIIEKIAVSANSPVPVHVVRLEGSVLTFRSLPLLIEHYCMNEQELATRLQLPSAIRDCKTTKQLQSIALMEQEFWTSEMTLSRNTPSNASSSSNGLRSFPHHRHDKEEASTWFMDNCAPCPNEDIKQEGSSYSQDVSNGGNSLKLKTKIRHSMSTASSSSGLAAFPDEPTHFEEVNSDTATARSPQMNFDRTEYDGPISRTEKRSQSVRSNKNPYETKGTILSHTIARTSRPRSFLRSLLSFGSSSQLPEKRKNSAREPSDTENANTPTNLASCQFFTPWDSARVKVKTSRSAFDIATPPTRGFFGGTSPKKRGNLGSYRSHADVFDDDNYTSGWKEALNEEMTAAKSGPSNSRSKNEMKTFKPVSDQHDEDVFPPGVSPRSRQLAMRREKSDLCSSNIGILKSNATRLAHHNESSPGPTSIHSGRVPMTPPVDANDPQTIRNCVEELRRKRLQSANEMMNPNKQSPDVIENEYDQIHGSPQIAMRRRQGVPSSYSIRSFGGGRGAEHRLSVPNLTVAADPILMGSVGQSARALKERIGRNGDGELTIINEGLVTPVVRRKNFGTVTENVLSNQKKTSRVAEVEGVSVAAGEVAKRRETLEAFMNQKKRSGSSSTGSEQSMHSRGPSDRTQSSKKESELIWRRAKQDLSKAQSTDSTPTAAVRKLVAPNSRPVATPTVPWSAVNYELKNRQQKIAKVRPTPQLRSSAQHLDMTIGDVSAASSARNSEYAQLYDFASSSGADVTSRVHLDVHSKLDDDAVSVAGTVFNEPWDSNAWDNLIVLAHHGDDNKVNEVIKEEEDSDSDRTAGGASTSNNESDDEDEGEVDEELRWPREEPEHKRILPSDRIAKAWDNDAESMSKYSTLDSRGTVSSFSLRSLPRALSRVSQATVTGCRMTAAASMGSIDDLPTTLPSMSPLLGGGGRGDGAADGEQNKTGTAVQEYVEQLALVREGANACFGLTLKQFIACTKDTKETDPSVVVRNVRQFINGMKNYLVKHGEGDLHSLIDKESARLNSNQILNIDACLEAVLHKLLLREVKPLLYHVMVREHSKSGALQLLSTNIALVRKMNLAQLGFTRPEALTTPSQQTMEKVKNHLRKMQNHYSPLKKLENLMRAVSLVISCQNNGKQNEENSDPATQRGIPAADDLVRWLVYILARTSTVGCEVEAWYMWELLPQPMLLQSDASYYLTALFSAVHILKSKEAIRRLSENEQQDVPQDIGRPYCASPLLSTATLTRGVSSNLSTSVSCDAFVKIAVPDEAAGYVRYTTFPGVPQLTTSKLSRVIAHQQGITNPEEHGLYLIADGFESCLQPSDCPVLIHDQLKKESKPHLFAYKRHEAKIVWPRSAIYSI